MNRISLLLLRDIASSHLIIGNIKPRNQTKLLVEMQNWHFNSKFLLWSYFRVVSRKEVVPLDLEYVVWWDYWHVVEWSPTMWLSSRTPASLPTTVWGAPVSTWSRGKLTTFARSGWTLINSVLGTAPVVLQVKRLEILKMRSKVYFKKKMEYPFLKR